jgi:K+-sensing histidine kinase KdpD
MALPASGSVVSPGRLPRAGTGLAPARRHLGLVLVFVGLPLLTALLVELRGSLALASMLLLYLLAVVLAAVVGGVLPAVLGAAASFVLANWFLTPPYRTLAVASRDSVIELVVFLLVALTVSVTVDVAARRRVAAVRSGIEAELLSTVTGEPLAQILPETVLQQIRVTFGLSSVAILEGSGAGEAEVARVGAPADGEPSVAVPAGPGLRVLGWGPATVPGDRRLLGALAQAAGRVVEGRRLAEQAARARELAAVDRLRSALLTAVGHELRTPLAGAKAAVSSLRQPDIPWNVEERNELLATIEESTDRLADLIANLLDLSRLQAGALSVRLQPVAVDEVAPHALIDARGRNVEYRVPEDLPLVIADPGLLERVIANLVDNAIKFAPTGEAVRVTAESEGASVRLRVIDHGPGVPDSRWDRLFVPFQRMDDRSSSSGLGLGLAIARGFTEAMHGSLEPSHTPGSGLTMTLTLPAAT